MGEDFITTGDRVVVTGNVHPYQGEHGEVIYEDGWGKCTVRLDTGRIISAWNASELERENEARFIAYMPGGMNGRIDGAYGPYTKREATIVASFLSVDPSEGQVLEIKRMSEEALTTIRARVNAERERIAGRNKHCTVGCTGPRHRPDCAMAGEVRY